MANQFRNNLEIFARDRCCKAKEIATLAFALQKVATRRLLR